MQSLISTNKITVNTDDNDNGYGTCTNNTNFWKTLEKLKSNMGHLIIFCICNLNYESIYCDMLSSPDFQNIVLNNNGLKHLSKYYYKNYTKKERIEMDKKGVLLSHISKIEFEKEMVYYCLIKVIAKVINRILTVYIQRIT